MMRNEVVCFENRAILASKEYFDANLVQDFLEKKYFSVISSLNLNGPVLSICPLERSLLGLSLCLSDRNSEGLRELSLAVELCTSTKLRCLGLLFLASGYYISGNVSEYAHVMANAQMTDSGVGIYEKFFCLNYPTMLYTSSRPNYPRIKFPNLSHRTSESHRILRNCVISLAQITSDVNLDLAEMVLDPLFESIMNFLNLSHSQDLDFVKSNVVAMETYWKDLMSGSPVDYRKMVKVMVVSGFCSLQKKDYQISYLQFQKSSDLILQFDNQNSIGLFSEKGMTHYRRSIYLLLAQASMKRGCVAYEPNNSVESYLERICIDMSQTMNTHEEIQCGRLEHYFQITGMLCLETVLISRLRKSEDVVLSKERLVDFIRRFIILSTVKCIDDATIKDVYDSILSGLCLHGGISWKVFQFFSLLKKHFSLEQSMHKLLRSHTEFSNFLKLINEALLPFKTATEQISLATEEKTLMEFELYSLPHLDINMNNEGTLEVRIKSSKSFLQNIREVANYRTESEEFVGLWMQSFKDFNKIFPEAILRVYRAFLA